MPDSRRATRDESVATRSRGRLVDQPLDRPTFDRAGRARASTPPAARPDPAIKEGQSRRARRAIQHALQTGQVELDLSGCQLTAVPAELGQLTNLRRLKLSFNRLSELPASFGQLTNLQVLDVSYNELTLRPVELGQMTNLEVLDLYHNQLTALPPELGGLAQLAGLWPGHNHLTAVPPELGRLTNLNVLHLSYNQLTVLPAELSRLARLVELDLEGNPLAEPLASLVEQGIKAVLAYLRSLEAPTPPTGQAPDSRSELPPSTQPRT